MLETVPGYARERSLEAGESEGAYARHRDWYLGSCARRRRRSSVARNWRRGSIGSRPSTTTCAPRSRGASTSRAARPWRSSSSPGCGASGRSAATSSKAGSGSIACSPQSADISVLRADALTGAGILAAAQGDHAAAVRYHEQSLRIHQELNNDASVRYALHNLANASLHRAITRAPVRCTSRSSSCPATTIPRAFLSRW